MIIVVFIENNVVANISSFPEEDRDKAEKTFFEWCEMYFSNFDEYTKEDRETILTQGYERGGERGVCISYLD